MVKIDGPCAIVRFPPSPGEESRSQGEDEILARYRALRLEDLAVSEGSGCVRSMTPNPRTPCS